MCGHPGMESYEEFCMRSLAMLQEGKLKKKICEPLCSLKTCSVIRFHGRPILLPLLRAEQHTEMHGYRQRAIQLEQNRENLQRNKLMDQVQVIMDQVQVQDVPHEKDINPPVCKSATVSGYTLVTDSPGLPKVPEFRSNAVEPPSHSSSETPIVNGYKEEKDLKVDNGERSEDEEEDDEDISLDSLLKRSREYVQREQNQQRSSEMVDPISKAPPAESVSLKQQPRCSPIRDSGVESGFSLHHSPVGPSPKQQQPLYDPSPQKSAPLSPVTPERYAHIPSPESSVSPRPCRRKPRPVSTGNIHISFPIGPADLIARSPGRVEDGAGRMDWSEALSAGSICNWGVEGRDSNRWSSHCGTSPVQENNSPVSASVSSAMARHDHLSLGFRRRCHTLDSQLNTFQSGAEQVDRSQERLPRFMAGVTWFAPSRHTPAAPLNQSYKVESPSPCLLRPRGSPDEPRVPNNSKKTPVVLKNTTELQAKPEETQWRAQALEDMQRRLEEEHALQMSILLAEQEKEQQRLHLELEETEKRLKRHECERPRSGDTFDWSHRSVSGSCPIMSPSCPGLSPIHTSERTSGHTLGFPSAVPASVMTPPVQPAAYLWGSSRTASKSRARLSLVLTAEHHKAFCKIGAMIRGFLVRRLLKTEKLKHLCQTVVDTQEFIQSFETEAAQKRGPYTAQDLSLQERVRAQLRAALYDIHEIFFEIPLRDRLALLQQDRELRAERKLRDLEKAKTPKDRMSLSAATQRSLDRKKKVSKSSAVARKVQHKPKSPTTNNRVQKSSQGQTSSTPGQLNRQGSWYRKTPEERVRRLDTLKKQHSLS
ncbi:centriolar coiled-coil protein of 110 kDa-like [Poeciliopsis prolifica]|uniref:centriolar coiled-coil protein of 110 kDa-like n=1 Tax=Poeciliopsis prolifica TaxID=188132 RepID=UPI002413643B|nr:centriolar coiled-coil protein of 110 kDa-like [Poeciliopsis prolifica]XP_054891129.1 centriolar coiled-coil protein of 110 kDa-like [Poeciliopsis prolifica]